MERLATLVAAAWAISLGTGAFAQQSAEPAPSTQAAQVSDQDLETFASIYEDLQSSATQRQAELARVQSEDDALKIQARYQQESLATVAKHGWTPQKYNAVASAISADPELAERAIALIDD
jgi:hypothetical protein